MSLPQGRKAWSSWPSWAVAVLVSIMERLSSADGFVPTACLVVGYAEIPGRGFTSRLCGDKVAATLMSASAFSSETSYNAHLLVMQLR